MNSKSLVTLLASAGLALLFSARPAAAQVFVSDFSVNGGIREYTFTGSFVRTFVAGGTNGLDRPSNIAFGPDGNLYVASYGGGINGAIKKYDGATGAFLGNVAKINGPYDLSFGSDGNLYVLGSTASAIYKIDPTTGTVLRTYTGISSTPEGFAIRPNGNFIVNANGGNDAVEVNALTGTITTFATNQGKNVGVTTSGPDDRVYFSGFGTSYISVVPSGGGVATRFSTGSIAVNAQYIAYGNGSFFVPYISNNDVRFYDGVTGAYTGFLSSPNATGIAIRGINVAAAAPEPSSLALLVLPALGVLVARRRTLTA